MSYLYWGLSPDNRTALVEDAKAALKGIKFDAFVGTGLSGALFGGIVAAAMAQAIGADSKTI